MIWQMDESTWSFRLPSMSVMRGVKQYQCRCVEMGEVRDINKLFCLFYLCGAKVEGGLLERQK